MNFTETSFNLYRKNYVTIISKRPGIKSCYGAGSRKSSLGIVCFNRSGKWLERLFTIFIFDFLFNAWSFSKLLVIILRIK
jgi:hypothetical protein